LKYCNDNTLHVTGSDASNAATQPHARRFAPSTRAARRVNHLARDHRLCDALIEGGKCLISRHFDRGPFVAFAVGCGGIGAPVCCDAQLPPFAVDGCCFQASIADA
jgi:hypothetical protein